MPNPDNSITASYHKLSGLDSLEVSVENNLLKYTNHWHLFKVLATSYGDNRFSYVTVTYR